MDWVKKHADTVVVMGGILSSVLWMNHQFSEAADKFYELEKDVAVIKAVLITRGYFPKELAVNLDSSNSK